MSTKDDGGPAFPDPQRAAMASHPQGFMYEPHMGMSLRDWFAGMALQGGLAASANLTSDHLRQLGFGDYSEFYRGLCVASFKIADAMLAARQP